MAFNFNWSPLTADASFYTRAQELLTSALNKSPKPPIIVDDILVSELNLGSVPPDLEILEVGDLAEDRFRGIFKMRYSGDAFLTLKTRVQANPLNTYLSTRPSFASPEPLAAASGLTIPIKITLSEIKLSAFIILVFSKQKGLTLVFRNDPLESLKVSSTFDSIPFVRDFLQRTIEQQLRNLLMEDVPAIIHRLSLRLFVPEYRAQEEAMAVAKGDQDSEEEAAHPFSSPPQDPVDMRGNPLGPIEITQLSLDSSDVPIFSHRNLLRLATLTESHRTLSPFTPTMKDVIYRVWAGSLERGDRTGVISPVGAILSRRQSQADLKGTSYSFSAAASEAGSSASRPGPPKSSTSFSRSSLGGATSKSSSGKPRKKKHRVINLRKRNSVDAGDLASVDEEAASETASTATSNSASADNHSAPASAPTLPTSFEALRSQYGDDEVVTPPTSPPMHRSSPHKRDLGKTPQRLADIELEGLHELTVRRPQPRKALFEDAESAPDSIAHESIETPMPGQTLEHGLPHQQTHYFQHQERPHLHRQHRQHSQPRPSPPGRPARPSRYFQSFQFPADRPSSPFQAPAGSSANGMSLTIPAASRGSSPDHQHLSPAVAVAPFPYGESSAPGGVLEQAWMMRMAGEIARRMAEHKEKEAQAQADARRLGVEANAASPMPSVSKVVWNGGSARDDSPPPAYAA